MIHTILFPETLYYIFHGALRMREWKTQEWKMREATTYCLLVVAVGCATARLNICSLA